MKVWEKKMEEKKKKGEKFEDSARNSILLFYPLILSGRTKELGNSSHAVVGGDEGGWTGRTNLMLPKSLGAREIEIIANGSKKKKKSQVYRQFIDDNKNVMFVRDVSSLRLLKPYFFHFILFWAWKSVEPRVGLSRLPFFYHPLPSPLWTANFWG